MPAKVQGTWRPIDPTYLGIASLTNVDTAAAYPLGTKIKARDIGATAYGDAEFIYMNGGTTVVAGSVVNFIGDGTCVLLAARAKGAVGLAISTVIATSFGWFQVRGKGVAKSLTVAANAACYACGTGGSIDDAAVAGDQIIGMQTNTTDDTSTCVVFMTTYPSMADFDNA